MKCAIVLSTLLLLTRLASAVDGYKDFEFGISVGEVKKIVKIPLSRKDSGNDVVWYLSTVEGFPFGGKKVPISFGFVGGKLLRVALKIPTDKTGSIINSLTEKYGPSSSSSGLESMVTLDSTPNAEAYVAFDGDTVFVKITSDESMQQRALLIYTSPEYDRHVLQSQKKSVED